MAVSTHTACIRPRVAVASCHHVHVFGVVCFDSFFSYCADPTPHPAPPSPSDSTYDAERHTDRTNRLYTSSLAPFCGIIAMKLHPAFRLTVFSISTNRCNSVTVAAYFVQYLHCALAAAQCIVIGPVCDHLLLIKFWPSRTPGRGSAAGRKFLAPLYCSQRAVFASHLSAFFIRSYVFVFIST